MRRANRRSKEKDFNKRGTEGRRCILIKNVFGLKDKIRGERGGRDFNKKITLVFYLSYV